MILTKNEILKLLKEKKLAITPLSKDQVGPASIDLTLGNEFRTFNKKSRVDLNEDPDYKKITEKITADKITLKPGDFLLGITKEKIKLPSDLCGILTGRSRFARLGLIIHTTSNFLPPGIDNKQVLEIKNLSNNELVLHAGTRICQLILIQAKGKTKYSGKYANQESI